jgi:hypothetical protein
MTSPTMMVYNFADHWDVFDNTEPLFNLGQWMRAWGVCTFERFNSADKIEKGECIGQCFTMSQPRHILSQTCRNLFRVIV